MRGRILLGALLGAALLAYEVLPVTRASLGQALHAKSEELSNLSQLNLSLLEVADPGLSSPSSVWPSFDCRALQGLAAKVSCERWAVVTSRSPTEAVRRVADLPGWCLVVVGDLDAPENYVQMANWSGREDVVFLSVEQQKQMPADLVGRTPLGSLARKNLGFLFAIQHGARVIYDFGDDHVIAAGKSPLALISSRDPAFLIMQQVKDRQRGLAFNPLPYMHPSIPHVWPHGFPTHQPHEERASTIEYASIASSRVAVVQAVCNGSANPPVTFRTDPKRCALLQIPSDSFAPYNAHATTHMYNAFWGLLLPWSLPERTAQVWRSFFTQRFLHELGLVLIYDGPLVERSPGHEYVGSEELDSRTGDLLKFLRAWSGNQSADLPTRMEQLTVDLYQKDYLQLADVDGMKAWLGALRCIGYEFPQAAKLRTFTEPSLEGQAFLASPERKRVTPKSKWSLEEAHARMQRPGDRRSIMKVVMMTRDEWPLVRDWVLYHGQLVGFQHLYIFDGGSKDPRVIAFLARARDHLGVSVIFSLTDLNHRAKAMSRLARSISRACDFLIKMDTDEFLVAHNSSCEGSSCLSPYSFPEALERMSSVGERLVVGWIALSVPGPDECAANALPLLGAPEKISHAFKTISDARTFHSFDLGGHHNQFIKPFGDDRYNRRTDIGVFHFHFRCFEEAMESHRKVSVGHGIFDDNDPLEVVKEKILSSLQINATTPCQPVVGKRRPSWNKVVEYFLYLAGCLDAKRWYSAYTAERFANEDFQRFLVEARARDVS